MDITKEKLLQTEHEHEKMRIKYNHLDVQLADEKRFLARETELREYTERELERCELLKYLFSKKGTNVPVSCDVWEKILVFDAQLAKPSIMIIDKLLV